ncbi:ABC transporter ATP-binding protein [Chryseolinea sp. T2]|uniref:ABC transporter ATP-binding protein n=1 Tax=Chryseolinea sp. T2 TaxID=3129255 RepID=UPI0030770739
MKGAQLLNTANLSVGYNEKPVFDGLNLGLSSGKFTCFMGPNGIGKSTLIRTLAGLQKPLGGAVSNKDQGRHPAVVLTDRIAAGYMTVRQLVTFGRYPYLSWNLKLGKTDSDAIESAIARLHLQSLADRRLHELSDGQIQLAQIARVLAQETNIILLDEPTAHLDLNNRLEITLLLRQLAHEGKAVLMATHELDLALQTADEVWLAGGPKGILVGAPEDLVLQGAFDDIFRLKGFDLLTGKVLHSTSRKMTVAVPGDHPAALWTRNALERSGYLVQTGDADLTISLSPRHSAGLEWTIDGGERHRSIESLLMALHHLEHGR